MAHDIVPPSVMTPKRLEISRSLGLASAIPYTQPEPVDPREHEGVPVVASEPVPVRPQLVGQTINGHEWLVVQVPAGVVREVMGSETLAREKARELAAAESGSFAVFQPRGISRPVTTVTDELL